ncbi:MBL fold metallo-hydrolase [Rhizobium leguminosarum]
MHCEIEFLPVGDASKAGDAVVLRYGNAFDYKLMLVDGGHAETGDQIVSHLRKHFGQRPVLEHVVLTHSDDDHASGLRTVLAEIEVKNLWLHLPWEHASETLPLFADKRWTAEGLRRAIKDQYSIVSEVHDLAVAQGTTISGAFQGQNIGPFHVCSPSVPAYNFLLPQFAKTPDPDQAAIEQAGMWLGKESLVKRIMEAAKAALQDWTTETWAFERLKDGGQTSASNESSVVLYGAFDNNARVLLTGDTGINGLTWTANYADHIGLPLRQFSFVQVPHHGSRRNVGPTVLNRLVGPILPQGSSSRFAAYISAPADDTKHPRRIVINAFTRRGGLPIATQGNSKVHWGGFPARQGYSNAEPLPFYTEVEEYT